MKLPDPENSPSEMMGLIQDAAVNAANKVIDKIMGEYGYDRAYWDFEFTARMRELGTDFKPLKEYTAIKHFEMKGE